RRHSTSAISAMPIGMPGWPEFAFCTASIASARITFTMSRRLAPARSEPEVCPARVSLFTRLFLSLSETSRQRWQRQNPAPSRDQRFAAPVHEPQDHRREDELHCELHFTARCDDRVGP